MPTAIRCFVASIGGIAALMACAIASRLSASRPFFSCLIATLRFPPVWKWDWSSRLDNDYDILLARYEFHPTCSDRDECGGAILSRPRRPDPAQDPGVAW